MASATSEKTTILPASPGGPDVPGPEQKAQHYLTESLTNASIDGMIALDTALRIVVWNDTAAFWSGKSREEVLGRPFFEVFPAGEELEALRDSLQYALEDKKVFLPPTAPFYLEGYYETHFVPLKDDSGQVTGVLQVIHDVAHRVKAENELKALNRELQQRYHSIRHANEELATFAKIASHDLKEPLRKIYTFAELIMIHEAGKLSNSGRSNFRRIQKSAQRMALLTDDIVNFSELNLNNESLAEIDMTQLLALALEPLQAEARQLQAAILIGELPKLNGYPGALRQLFYQVLSNALKFHRKQTAPEIRIQCQVSQPEGIAHEEAVPGTGYYHFTVEDNGIGFEPQYSERIFSMFERLHPEGTYKGSGMGLAMAQKAARMHDGFLSAESLPGSGSIFHCYIPVDLRRKR